MAHQTERALCNVAFMMGMGILPYGKAWLDNHLGWYDGWKAIKAYTTPTNKIDIHFPRWVWLSRYRASYYTTINRTWLKGSCRAPNVTLVVRLNIQIVTSHGARAAHDAFPTRDKCVRFALHLQNIRKTFAKPPFVPSRWNHVYLACLWHEHLRHNWEGPQLTPSWIYKDACYFWDHLCLN
jgi:hypothetical protein